MSEKKLKKIQQGIVKSERKITLDGTGYVEKTLNVYGENLKEINKIFQKEWNKDE